MIIQNILPVISDWKTFEAFLKGAYTWCILMDFHMNFMEDLEKQQQNISTQPVQPYALQLPDRMETQEQLLNIVEQKRIRLQKLERMRPTLEQFFLEVTK